MNAYTKDRCCDYGQRDDRHDDSTIERCCTEGSKMMCLIARRRDGAALRSARSYAW